MNTEKDTLGFIGLGVMGTSMAGHLMKAGYTLRIHTRTKDKATELLEQGAIWESSPAALAPSCSAIFTMVGYPSDVEEVYLGSEGLVERAKPGTYLVDMTTSRPDLARRIAELAAKRGIAALDAPVSGGDIGARNATLAIMVGGEEDSFLEVRGLLELMGKTIVLQGPPGAGQYVKMANQIAVAGNLLGAVEAISYAREAGLDPTTVLQSIASGAAGSWQLSNMVPRMLDGNFDPGFFVKHYLKDLRIALESAKAMGIRLPMLELAERLFERLHDKGYGERGTQVLFLLYQLRLAGEAVD